MLNVSRSDQGDGTYTEKRGLTAADVKKLYDEAESVDKELFAEMRSNCLLVAGEHYQRTRSLVRDRLRESTTELNESQKLRITKNHTHKVARIFEDALCRRAPGIAVTPHRDTEQRDIKTAELNQSVWDHDKKRYRFAEKFRQFAQDFVRIGEVCVLVQFDPGGGKLKGYNQATHPETGEPLVDEQGQPQADQSSPVMSGALHFKRIFGFNLLRESGSTAADDAKAWIVRDMMTKTDALKLAGDNPDAQKAVKGATGDIVVLFDAQKNNYSKANADQVMIVSCFWPVSQEYPEGWYWMGTLAGEISQGPLPGGIWPIAFARMDEHPTSPRGRSVIKVARPFQAEINRASSAMALHQVTIGDDKIVYQAGTKLAQGALLPGVRGVTFQGARPEILPGRDGGQYLKYIEANISELYDVLMLTEMQQEDKAQVDPYTMLFRSMAQNEKFAGYAGRFSQFLVDFADIVLELERMYLPDDEIIQAVGRAEQVNIAEFKNADPMYCRIDIEEQDDTISSKLGKQLTMNHILQYVGPQLQREDIGKVLANMPFGNVGEEFGDFMLDYENAQNDMLALERGEMPAFNELDDHKYMLKRLANRMKKRDFQFLPPQVQQAYAQKKDEHEQAVAMEAAKIAAAKNEYVPTGGAMVACDMYIQDPAKPEAASKRVRIPYQSLDWLVKILETQGQNLSSLEEQNQAVLAEIATKAGPMMAQGGGGAPGQGSPQGQVPAGAQGSGAGGVAHPVGVS